MHLQDVMHIGANVGKITLAARYGPELGEYMMHCHNNVHEDNDMFRAFMVSAAETHSFRGLLRRRHPLCARPPLGRLLTACILSLRLICPASAPPLPTTAKHPSSPR